MQEPITQFLPPFLATIDPALLFVLFLLVTVWSLVWKGLALWYAAQSRQSVWFVVLLVVNTLGIVDIVYLLLFAKASPFKRKTTSI
jgi:hypothetical protein